MTALALSLLAGCDPAGVLVVELRTDLRSPDEVTHARVRVRSSIAGTAEVERLTALPVGTAVEALRLAEVPSLPPGDIEIAVDLFEGLERVIGRVVLVTGYRGEQRVVTVLISRSCRDAACPPADARDATECLGGRCVLPGCTPETPELCPDPECTDSIACPDEGECRQGRCIAGTCFALSEDARCAAGARCMPDGLCASPDADAGAPLDGGGQSDGGPLDASNDAGMDDGGPPDGGPPDGGPPDGGPRCEPADCDDGNPCTDDACALGVCINEPNEAGCDDGLFCNGADSCSGSSCSMHAGDPCSGDAICDESGRRCTGCLVSGDCGPPLVSAWSACAGFSETCDSTGTQSQTTTTFSCDAGTCVGSDTMDSRACTRMTEGATCSATTCTAWSSCTYPNACAQTGIESRTCTDWACSSDACRSTMRPEARMGSCTRSTDGAACTVDGNRCTRDVCASGVCTHPALPDGSQCTSEGTTGADYLCCAGTCRYTVSNSDHCGGCFVRCGTLNCNNSYCRACTDDAHCSANVAAGFVCNTVASPDRCQCTMGGGSSCPRSWQYCRSSDYRCRGIAP